MQPTCSNEVRAGSLEVQVQKGSSEFMKIVVTETTDESPGADVDDGFAMTESELAVYLGEAAERKTLAGNGIVMCGQQAARSEQCKGSCP